MESLWEAGIKSVKYHLKRALGRSRLTYEEFKAVIIQVEGILNSRPLTPISNDFDNFEIKPSAENKGNSVSLEKMEYRLSEYSPTENQVDDREGQCNVWYNGNCKGGFYTSFCNWLLGRVVEVCHGSDGTPKRDITNRLTGVGSLLPPFYSEAWAKAYKTCHPYVIVVSNAGCSAVGARFESRIRHGSLCCNPSLSDVCLMLTSM
ncbi:integrase catalytic domain-containing protein [Trichonephila clavipes]|uniref:Integrase catalytic domain-containing protein n=1 Tax=Trichonephila clavipes TaxID=2585209 RepID=A0A8X6T1F3_TRICX|nr:integrase catalytic domain-containing protein [Trichonephila clavipes]